MSVAAGPQAILSSAQDGRFILEDFKPLSESIEWDFGQRYWRERGSLAFTGDMPVPFVINNDGVLSGNAAELLFHSLLEAEKDGALEPHILVLELGIGVGLFARFFLDAFKDRCAQGGKDYYQRLIYVGGDRSERMLVDACRNGIFAHHRGRYLLRTVDAFQPEKYLTAASLPAQPVFRAVFLNYVLDCLPCTQLKVDGDEVSQLMVRTCLARNVNLKEFANLMPDALAARIASDRIGRRQSLLHLYDLFATEYA